MKGNKLLKKVAVFAVVLMMNALGLLGLNDGICTGITPTVITAEAATVSYYPKCSSSYTSIVDALRSIGVDSSYTNRAKIAAANGISNYSGTTSQNSTLLTLLKRGSLKKPGSSNTITTKSTTQKCGDVSYYTSAKSSNYYYYNNNTYVTSTMQWSWSKCPLMRYKDIVAMSNSAGFHVAQNANCSGDVCVSSNVATCTINYKLLPNSSVSYDTRYNPKSVSYKVYTKANGRGAYVKFPMTKTYIINGARVTFYAYSGTMSVKWEKSGNNRSIGLTSCYGHYTVNITPKVNFNGYDIEFTGKCKYGREAYLTMKR